MVERSYPIAKDWSEDQLIEHLALAMAHARHPSAREDARTCLAKLRELGWTITPPTEADPREVRLALQRDKSDLLTEIALRNKGEG